MAHKALAILTIILGASLSIAYLYYAPSHLALTLADPPPTPYSNNITASYVTLITIEIHAANAGNNSACQTLATDVTVHLITTLSTAKRLSTTQIPPVLNT